MCFAGGIHSRERCHGLRYMAQTSSSQKISCTHVGAVTEGHQSKAIIFDPVHQYTGVISLR
jgi:hypothetical protein